MLAGLMCAGFEIFIVLPEQIQTQTVLQIIIPTNYMQKAPISPPVIPCTHGSSVKSKRLHSHIKESQSNKLPSSPLQTGQVLFQIKLL